MGHLRLKTQTGFTLMEVMVVLSIIAAMIALAAPRLGNSNNEMKATVRRLSVLIREAHNHSRLFGVNHRLVIDMGEAPGSPDNEQKYWLEASSQAMVLPEEKNSVISEELERDQLKKEGKEVTQSPWEPAVRIMKNPIVLSGSLQFTKIEIQGFESPVETGRAYIHFFSQGLTEEAIIQLKTKEDLTWSVITHPLTGRADIVTKEVTLRDLETL